MGIGCRSRRVAKVAPLIALLTAGLAGCARTINHGGTAPPCMGRISADTRVFSGDSVEIGARMRRTPLIGYPPEWAPDSSHRVVLRYHVLATGMVDSASIKVMSSTDARFTDLAVRTAARSRFWPACKGGEAVAILVQQAYRYGR
jgi:TonB family protein